MKRKQIQLLSEQVSESKQSHFRLWKSGKKWLYTASILTVLLGGVMLSQSSFLGSTTAYALSLPSGATQIGNINGAPVVKSPTDNMQSSQFQQIVSSLLQGTNSSSYIVDNVAWGSSTNLVNGSPLSSSDTAGALNHLSADGFNDTDNFVEIPSIGGHALIQNVGSARDQSGNQIPLDLAITMNGITGKYLDSTDNVILAAKSQGSVITLGFIAPIMGDATGGGQTENGGSTGGGSGAYMKLSTYMDSVSYTLTLVNHDTGQALPNNTLMAMKLSDIDASQQAVMSGQGDIGYIIGPNSVLTQSGNGFKSGVDDGAVNADSTRLTSRSYLVLKQYNSNAVTYTYTDGADNHIDLVTGVFGNTGVQLLTPPTPPTPPTLATVPTVTEPLVPKMKVMPVAPKFTPVVDDTNPTKDVLSMKTGKSVNGGETLTDVKWDWVVSKEIKGSDTEYSDFLAYQKAVTSWEDDCQQIAADNAKAKADYDSAYANYTKDVVAANVVIDTNNQAVTDYNKAYATYDAAYQNYQSQGGQEAEADKANVATTATLTAEAKVELTLPAIPASPDTTLSHFLFDSMTISDSFDDSKVILDDVSKMYVTDASGNKLNAADYKITTTNSNGKTTVQVNFAQSFIYSDAFYANTCHLHVPSITNIDDQTKTDDSQENPNTADVTVDNKSKKTNKVKVKPIYTDESIKKSVMQYDGTMSSDVLLKSNQWKTLENLKDHDTLYAYKVDYQLGNHADFNSITLSDPHFADLQVAPDDIAVYYTVTDSNGQTSQSLLSKDQYTVTYGDSDALQVDAKQADTSGFKIDLKNPNQYARKTTQFTVILKDVTLKGASGHEEFNYLQTDDKVHVYNVGQLDWLDKTPTDTEKTKGLTQLKSNRTEVIPPTIGPAIDKFVETDSASDGSAETEQGASQTTAESTANQSTGQTTDSSAAGSSTDQIQTSTDATATIKAAVDALNAELSVTGAIVYEKGSSFDTSYQPLLDKVDGLKDAQGNLRPDVTVDDITQLTAQLKAIEGYSTKTA